MFQLSGPYRVVSQTKNDVQVRSLVYDNILTFNLDHLKVFIGTEAEAKSIALLDKNQYLIKEVQAYRGDQILGLVRGQRSCVVALLSRQSNTTQFEAFIPHVQNCTRCSTPS